MADPSDCALAAARASIQRMCPAEHRQHVTQQLMESIAVAETLAPGSWAVTRFDSGFRMNVGPVEAYACFDGQVRLLLACAPESAATGNVVAIHYASLPLPQAVYIASAQQFSEAREALRSAHQAYLEAAALTKNGRPRKCSYSRYHCEAFVILARQCVADRECAAHPSTPVLQKQPGRRDRLPDTPRNPYNGFTWAEREAKYREMRRRIQSGLMAAPHGPCRLCGDPGGVGTGVSFEYHDEDYGSEYSWEEPAAYVLCHDCHVNRLHRRFGNPAGWQAFIAHVRRGGYARDLKNPDVQAEIKRYQAELQSGRLRLALRGLRPYHTVAGEEWFAKLSLNWNDMVPPLWAQRGLAGD